MDCTVWNEHHRTRLACRRPGPGAHRDIERGKVPSAARVACIARSACTSLDQNSNKRYSSCRYNERQLIEVTVVRRVRPRAEHNVRTEKFHLLLFCSGRDSCMLTSRCMPPWLRSAPYPALCPREPLRPVGDMQAVSCGARSRLYSPLLPASSSQLRSIVERPRSGPMCRVDTYTTIKAFKKRPRHA